QLGADDEAEPGAERVRLAPPEVAARRHRAVEGQELVARAPGVVGDDRLARIRRAHELGDHPVGAHGDVARAEDGRPLAEPRRAHAPEFGADTLASRRAAALALDRLDD